MKTFVGLAVSLLVLVAGFAALEAFCRLRLPEVSDTFVMSIVDVHEKYHHRFVSWAEAEKSPDEQAVRLLFLGDSFTAGSKPTDFYFPDHAGKWLDDHCRPAGETRRFQSFNLGSPSYSPSIESVLLRDFTPRIRPDVVVLALDDSDPQDDMLYAPSVRTDETGMPVSAYPALRGVPGWLDPLAREVKLVRWFLGNLGRTPYEALDPLLRWENRLGHYFPEFTFEWSRAFKGSLSLVDRMAAFAAQHGARLLIVNYPYPPAVSKTHAPIWRTQFGFRTDRLYEPAFHGAVRDFARARGLAYYDFTPRVRAEPDPAVLYLEEDCHFNADGQALLGEEVGKAICGVLAAARP